MISILLLPYLNDKVKYNNESTLIYLSPSVVSLLWKDINYKCQLFLHTEYTVSNEVLCNNLINDIPGTW